MRSFTPSAPIDRTAMPSKSSIARKARTKAEADFATWLMMAKLGGFDELPPNAQTFLTDYRTRLQSTFADVAEMEKHAETIEDWAPSLIPGLLQTRAYAQKVVETSLPWLPPETVENQVKARMERAKLWEGEEHPSFWAVLHESLIRRPLLDPEEMAVQLRHIAHVIRSTQSVLQILPEHQPRTRS